MHIFSGIRIKHDVFFSSEIPEVSESLHFISLGEGIPPKGHTSPGKWPIVYVLKTSSDKIIYWLGRYSFLLGFIMSKNPKGLRFYIQYTKTL